MELSIKIDEVEIEGSFNLDGYFEISFDIFDQKFDSGIYYKKIQYVLYDPRKKMGKQYKYIDLPFEFLNALLEQDEFTELCDLYAREAYRKHCAYMIEALL